MSRSTVPTATEVVEVTENAVIYIQDTDSGFVQMTPEIGYGGRETVTMAPSVARALAAKLTASADRMEKQGDARFRWNTAELEK